MKIDISHLAKLANLPLSKEEIKKFEKQLLEVLGYVNQLQEINTKNIEPTSQVTGLKNVMDEDTPRPSLSQREVLSGAKTKHNNKFQVKGIFDNE